MSRPREEVMHYGEYRSAREVAHDAEQWAELWKIASALDNSAESQAARRDWWLVADLDAVAELVKWGPGSGCGAYRDWDLRLSSGRSVPLLNSLMLNIKPLIVPFAIEQADRALHIWEAWAEAVPAHHLPAPKEAIEAAGAMLTARLAGGVEPTKGTWETTRGAVWDASNAARDAEIKPAQWAASSAALAMNAAEARQSWLATSLMEGAARDAALALGAAEAGTMIGTAQWQNAMKYNSEVRWVAYILKHNRDVVRTGRATQIAEAKDAGRQAAAELREDLGGPT
jgi:hypothetical protein